MQRSDFLSLIRIWQFYHEQARKLSRNKLRKLCKSHFLSPLRMQEWHDTYNQLLALVHDMGLQPNQEQASYASVHRALLTGLLGNIAQRTADHEYTGARNLKLGIFPGSGQFKQLCVGHCVPQKVAQTTGQLKIIQPWI